MRFSSSSAEKLLPNRWRQNYVNSVMVPMSTLVFVASFAGTFSFWRETRCSHFGAKILRVVNSRKVADDGTILAMFRLLGSAPQKQRFTHCALIAAVGLLARSTTAFPAFPNQNSCATERSMSTTATETFTVAQIPCLDDNYGYLIHCAATGETAAVDTPDAKAYETELQKRGWKLTHILNTHQYVLTRRRSAASV